MHVSYFPKQNSLYDLKPLCYCLHGMYAVKYVSNCYKILTPENPGRNLTLVPYKKV